MSQLVYDRVCDLLGSIALKLFRQVNAVHPDIPLLRVSLSISKISPSKGECPACRGQWIGFEDGRAPQPAGTAKDLEHGCIDKQNATQRICRIIGLIDVEMFVRKPHSFI